LHFLAPPDDWWERAHELSEWLLSERLLLLLLPSEWLLLSERLAVLEPEPELEPEVEPEPEWLLVLRLVL